MLRSLQKRKVFSPSSKQNAAFYEFSSYILEGLQSGQSKMPILGFGNPEFKGILVDLDIKNHVIQNKPLWMKTTDAKPFPATY